jgi:exodeoxyribonuclease V alpha subunit
VSKTLEIVKNRIPGRFGFDPIDGIQVLCPMNRGGVGARSLNLELQKMLNPAEEQPAVERFGWRIAPGDKVMQTQNDHERRSIMGIWAGSSRSIQTRRKS